MSSPWMPPVTQTWMVNADWLSPTVLALLEGGRGGKRSSDFEHRTASPCPQSCQAAHLLETTPKSVQVDLEEFCGCLMGDVSIKSSKALGMLGRWGPSGPLWFKADPISRSYPSLVGPLTMP